MDDHSKRERQRKDRDARYKARNERQMAQEMQERKRELEKMQQEIERKLKEIDISQENLDYSDEEDRQSTDSEFEDAEETHEAVTTRSSIWSTLVSGAASYLTPTFLKKKDATSTPASILKKKRIAPRMRQLDLTEEEDHSETHLKEIATDSLLTQEERAESLIPATDRQNLETEEYERLMSNVKIEERSTEEIRMIESIHAMQLQAEQMAHKRQQRELEESQLAENIRIMDQRKREISKEKEKERKLLIMKQEEERLKQLLQMQYEEEAQQLKRIEMLQQKEILMKKEIEETDRQLALNLEMGARPKVYDHVRHSADREYISEIDISPKKEEHSKIVRKEELYSTDKIEKGLVQQQSAPIKQEDFRKEEIEREQKELKAREMYSDIAYKMVDGNNKIFLSSFSGADPVPQKEVCFEDWKKETNYIINSKAYSELKINQTLRNSLRGQARKVVNNLRPDVSTAEIIAKLERVFGNVASGASIVQEFYNAYQKPGESTTDWGLRLEELFDKAKDKGHVVQEQKELMLRNKFWHDLHRQDLKAITHVYFVSDDIDFETLRQKVKTEEHAMAQERVNRQRDTSETKAPHGFSKVRKEAKIEKDTVEVHQQKAQKDNSNTQTLIDLAKDIKEIKTNMSSTDNRRPYYRGGYGRGRGRGRGRGKQNNFNDNQSQNNNASEQTGDHLNA